jgi:hypothetical protein
LRQSELMGLLECMIHFLNEAIQTEVGAMLQEFIGSEEHQIGETPGTRENHRERHVPKGCIHDRHGHSCACLALVLMTLCE